MLAEAITADRTAGATWDEIAAVLDMSPDPPGVYAVWRAVSPARRRVTSWTGGSP